MSADNWRTCPVCLARAKKEKNRKHEKAAEAYGKVPPESWRQMVAEAEKPVDLEDNLREDYELGVTDEGKFYVIYSCSCSACGWRHTFRHEEQLSLDVAK